MLNSLGYRSPHTIFSTIPADAKICYRTHPLSANFASAKQFPGVSPQRDQQPLTVRAQDRLHDAFGADDGVIQADRCGQIHTEGDRLGVHMLMGDDVIASQNLDGRIHHVIPTDEVHIEGSRERCLVDHRSMLVSDARFRAVYRNVRQELVDQAASAGGVKSIKNAIHQGRDRQSRRSDICLAQTDAYEEQARFPSSVITCKVGFDLVNAMDGVT